jgi:hypothetical protein
MRWLHGLLHDPDQVAAQRIQVCLVSQRSEKLFEGHSRVVFPIMEAPVYERLDAAPQGIEQCSYH